MTTAELLEEMRKGDEDGPGEEVVPSTVEVDLDTPNGPRVEYGGHDTDTVEAEIPDGYIVDWASAVKISASGAHVTRWRAPLVVDGDAKTTRAAEDAVSTYLSEFGSDAAWDDSWFTTAYEGDSQTGGPCEGATWTDYRDAARSAIKRSQDYRALGCFDAASISQLIVAGVTPDDLGRAEANKPERLHGRTVGYWHSNGDLTTEDVLTLSGSRVEDSETYKGECP